MKRILKQVDEELEKITNLFFSFLVQIKRTKQQYSREKSTNDIC